MKIEFHFFPDQPREDFNYFQYSIHIEAPNRILEWVRLELMSCVEAIRRMATFGRAKGDF